MKKSVNVKHTRSRGAQSLNPSDLLSIRTFVRTSSIGYENLESPSVHLSSKTGCGLMLRIGRGATHWVFVDEKNKRRLKIFIVEERLNFDDKNRIRRSEEDGPFPVFREAEDLPLFTPRQTRARGNARTNYV